MIAAVATTVVVTTNTWGDHAVGAPGARKANGMVSFANVMSPAQIETVRQYMIRRANEDKAFEDAQ